MGGTFKSNLKILIIDYIQPLVKDKKILEAFRKVPRHLFVDKKYEREAYLDQPIPIGFGQTTSQPSLIAKMISLLEPSPDKKILEIGTGSGYQTALLALLVKKVYSIERICPLVKKAKRRLQRLGYVNTNLIVGDGLEGLPTRTLFDGIIVSAVASRIPQLLIDRLKEGGRIVIPVGNQTEGVLVVGVKQKGKLLLRKQMLVFFVPLVGKLS